MLTAVGQAQTLWRSSHLSLAVLLAVVLQAAEPGPAPAAAVRYTADGQSLRLTATGYVCTLAAVDGQVLSLVAGPAESATPVLAESGDLWSVAFDDGQTVTASGFLTPPWAGRMTPQWREAESQLDLIYTAPALEIAVHIAAKADCLDLQGEIRSTARPVLKLDLPSRLVFPVATVQRLVFPQRAGRSSGIAFTRSFFEAHHGELGGGWYEHSTVGAQAYSLLVGGALQQLPDGQPPIRLRVTDEGRNWFSPAQIAAIEAHPMSINRPPSPGQLPLVLVDSDTGPALGGTDLGGKGLLLRFCGKDVAEQRAQDQQAQTTMIVGASAALARQRPDAFRGRVVALLALKNGPRTGAWTPTSVADWQTALTTAPFVRASGATAALIESAKQLREALASERYALILNPYGEWLPTGEKGAWREVVEAIRDFVRRGGVWWEVGGYPFYYELVQQPYLSYAEQYPSATADFVHLDAGTGQLSLFGVQPLRRKPWESAGPGSDLTFPAELQTGGEPRGGYLRHAWHAAVEPGRTCLFPPLRLVPGLEVRSAMARYGATIGLQRTFAEKVAAPVRERLERAVLVRYSGVTAAEQTEGLEYLPAGSLVHFTEFLRGGFDKQYPDHLPPRPTWGTAAELAAFYRRAHDLGHLMMPYTNTSWWCIGPKGPTFEAEGDAPLARQRNGKPVLERYAQNEGYRVCYWHPAVQEAHRRTRRQFTDEYPSDVLFQDQVGARGWTWDYNPAAPTPTACTDGLHSLSMEDAVHVPLATEDGYDRVVEFETMLCGMAWSTVPSGTRFGRALNRDEFPAGDWEIFPLLQFLAHDKALFTLHDLGHFVTDVERQAYTLALGYGMSYACSVGQLRKPEGRTWLYWLAAVQEGVCSRYAGQPLLEFRDRGGGNAGPVEGGAWLSARYPGVDILANTGSRPAALAGAAAVGLPAPAAGLVQAKVAGPGFYVWGPGLEAGFLVPVEAPDQGFGVVATWDESAVRATVLAAAAQRVRVPVPWSDTRLASVRVSAVQPGMAPAAGTSFQVAAPDLAGGEAWITLPDGQVRDQLEPMPEDARLRPPNRWRASPRTVAVIAFEPEAPSSWVRLKAADWLAALAGSEVLRTAGYQVVGLRSVAELTTALEAAPGQRPMAIVNPGGECYYAESLAGWEAMLDRIGRYVRGGGIWWETGGYSFYVCAAPRLDATGQVQGWESRPTGPAGAAKLGFSVAGYDVEDPPETLVLTETGRQWLGPERARRLESAATGVQRSFAEGEVDLVLAGSPRDDWLAATRGGGWGWLWRLGGFNPVPDAATDAVVGTIEYLATHPWPTPAVSRSRSLWRVEVRR